MNRNQYLKNSENEAYQASEKNQACQDRIGVMGGSFNPFHNGHLELVIQTHRQFHLNRILVMPSYNPQSYKDTSGMADSVHRCNMIQTAIADYDYMELSLMEIERGGITYTSDTLRELKKTYALIYFIIGADSLFHLSQWHEAEYVLKNCHFIAANRYNMDEEALFEQARALKEHYDARIDFLKLPDISISSSEIRERVAKGLTIQGMVPDSIERYIMEHNLYRTEERNNG